MRNHIEENNSFHHKSGHHDRRSIEAREPKPGENFRRSGLFKKRLDLERALQSTTINLHVLEHGNGNVFAESQGSVGIGPPVYTGNVASNSHISGQLIQL